MPRGHIERAIFLSMEGRTRRTRDNDVVSELADVGEDALRRLVDVPRRIVIATMDGVAERLHDVAMKLRAIDPLDGRLGAIERRLDSLEQSKKEARAAPTRAKPTPTRKASTPPAREPEQAPHDSGRPDDARAEHEREQDEARSGDEGGHAR